MKILIATDAWEPQVNGVVRTLKSLANAVRKTGAEIEFLTPEGFVSFPLPTYAELRCAIPFGGEIARRIGKARPDAIHIATEGPIGYAVRRFCIRRQLPFTTSYTTRFPEYISARSPIPESWTYAALRRFHGAAAATMVSTNSMMDELGARGFERLAMWTRGVDTALFNPDYQFELDLPRPIFMYAGRVAVEKNIEAFLDLRLPGTKVVVGRGPALEELRQRYPETKFLGLREGRELAAHLAAADVFVFPSKTDTFGLVQLEALACGTPVAAFPVTGPKDVIGNAPVGILSDDLRGACISALQISRNDCREFALLRSWDMSASQFIGNLKSIRLASAVRPAPSRPLEIAAQ
jgi:glycosyltransferase involved in cell wall biosynthesis